MGCCSSNVEKFSMHSRNFNSVAPDIDKVTSSFNTPYSINDPMAEIENLTFNSLGLALYQGNLAKFKILKEICRADPKQMEMLFTKQNLCSFEILFKKGHLDLVKYYLPIFMLSCDCKINDVPLLSKPLLLEAVRYQHLNIVKYVYKYFSDVEAPAAFDIHAVDHERCENSALIACKNCDLDMVRYLHEECKVNFLVKDKKNQTPLIVAGFSSEDNESCFELVKYLIEKVSLDTSPDYEYLLEIFEESRIKDLIRKDFLGFDNSFASESVSRISEITVFDRKDEDLTISDLNLF
jgi:hypothetical protein